jgi:hypothetical protein
VSMLAANVWTEGHGVKGLAVIGYRYAPAAHPRLDDGLLRRRLLRGDRSAAAGLRQGIRPE